MKKQKAVRRGPSKDLLRQRISDIKQKKEQLEASMQRPKLPDAVKKSMERHVEIMDMHIQKTKDRIKAIEDLEKE